ncbi:cytochrome P450, partial [Mycolicibacterium vaccae]|nr:cytochrome P450 [Mycolicibacterium vaccae]
PPRASVLVRAAANRDPDAFTNADVFDIERDQTEAQHLGLGYGIHSAGRGVARMESRIAIEHLLDFMPRYEVNWDGLQRVHMQNVAGYQNVPVRVLR